MTSSAVQVVSMSGNDSFTLVSSLGTTILTCFADGTVGELTFPNDISSIKAGKNGNAIYALNVQGTIADLKLRLIRGSSDDKVLNQLLNTQQGNFPTFVLMALTIVKLIGSGPTGNPANGIINDVYNLTGGVFSKIPEVKSNVDGDTEQSVTMYSLRFANSQVVRQIS
jgi:hypothetical protein